MARQLVLITGGARSGKSAFAQKLAAELGRRVTFVATAEARDEEMRRRIEQHRRARPAHWRTVEAPLRAAEAVAAEIPRADVILLDCLGLLIANLMDDRSPDCGEQDDEFEQAVSELLQAYETGSASLVVVTNEVGMGVVPAYPLGRAFRDCLGRANQVIARSADRVYFIVAGMPVELKASGLACTWERADG